MTAAALRLLIERWRDDPGGTYQAWFLWDERLKNFRSIRRGLEEVVREIADGSFGNQYRGSSLETVVGSIAEQRQIFTIVKGYNALTGSGVRLGRWEDYLAMRAGVLRLNTEHRELLSNDLGAIAGLLFDVGTGRYLPPPDSEDPAAHAAWEADLARVRQEAATLSKLLRGARESDRTHAEVQGWLRDLGRALGFDVWVAANDRTRALGGGRLGDGCLAELPRCIVETPGAEAVPLIDVLWLTREPDRVAAAFEVEHTTSIYSGIVRLLDLALGLPGEVNLGGLFLVAPDDREHQVRQQLRRPAFRRVADLDVRYVPYGELERHRESMARFGEGLKAVQSIARRLL